MSKQVIKGSWYPKGSSDAKAAQMLFDSEGNYVLQIDCPSSIDDTEQHASSSSDFQEHERGEQSLLSVSDRVGNIERRVSLQDGSTFTTPDNAAIDDVFKSHASISGFIHIIEGNMKWVFVAIFVTIFTVYSFGRWGIPWVSQEIAQALPQKTNDIISEGSLALLDEHFFKETELSPNQQAQITQHFQNNLVVLEHNPQIKYRLHFRQWNMNGVAIPNAFALPSGDIILTDKFVELTQSQDEMDSVLLHEMGHVVHRHGLEKIIQSTTVSVLLVVTLGDTSSLVDLVVGTAGVLLSSAYSREHETEADVYAFKKMLQAGIDPNSFATIMDRMTSYMNEGKTSPQEDEQSYMDFFASHPETKVRIELAQKYSECFRKNDFACE